MSRGLGDVYKRQIYEIGENYMIKLGEVYNVIDDQTLQIKSLDDDELYEIKGSILAIADIRDSMEDESNSTVRFIEYDDEQMEMVV